MSTGICKSPGRRYWRELYKAALSEIGTSKLLERIAEAEKAVVLRARELFQAAGDNGEETEALEDVMYALHALGSNCQMRQGSPQHLKDGEPAHSSRIRSRENQGALEVVPVPRNRRAGAHL